MERTRILLRRGGAHFEVEGSEEFVSRTLPELKELLNHVAVPPDEEADGDPPSEEPPSTAGDKGRQSLRAFFEEKKPQNAYEAIACAVYYLCKLRGKDEVTSDEVRQSLMNAKQRPPGVMAQALTDCRRRYGYIETGTKKGFWRLSHEGEVTVEIDLPRQTKQK